MIILDAIAAYLNEHLPQPWHAKQSNCVDEIVVTGTDQDTILYIIADSEDPSIIRLGGILSPSLSLSDPDSLDAILTSTLWRIHKSQHANYYGIYPGSEENTNE